MTVGKPNKRIEVDDKDKAKIIALYGPPTHMTLKDLQLRFYSYTHLQIRAVLTESGAVIETHAKRSGVYLSTNERQLVK